MEFNTLEALGKLFIVTFIAGFGLTLGCLLAKGVDEIAEKLTTIFILAFKIQRLKKK